MANDNDVCRPLDKILKAPKEILGEEISDNARAGGLDEGSSKGACNENERG